MNYIKNLLAIFSFLFIFFGVQTAFAYETDFEIWQGYEQENVNGQLGWYSNYPLTSSSTISFGNSYNGLTALKFNNPFSEEALYQNIATSTAGKVCVAFYAENYPACYVGDYFFCVGNFSVTAGGTCLFQDCVGGLGMATNPGSEWAGFNINLNEWGYYCLEWDSVSHTNQMRASFYTSTNSTTTKWTTIINGGYGLGTQMSRIILRGPQYNRINTSYFYDTIGTDYTDRGSTTLYQLPPDDRPIFIYNLDTWDLYIQSPTSVSGNDFTFNETSTTTLKFNFGYIPPVYLSTSIPEDTYYIYAFEKYNDQNYTLKGYAKLEDLDPNNRHSFFLDINIYPSTKSENFIAITNATSSTKYASKTFTINGYTTVADDTCEFTDWFCQLKALLNKLFTPTVDLRESLADISNAVFMRPPFGYVEYVSYLSANIATSTNVGMIAGTTNILPFIKIFVNILLWITFALFAIKRILNFKL